jgi:hypothetical protein
MKHLFLITLYRKEYKGDRLIHEETWDKNHVICKRHFTPILNTVLVDEAISGDDPSGYLESYKHILEASVLVEVEDGKRECLEQTPLSLGKKLILDHLSDKGNDLHFK